MYIEPENGIITLTRGDTLTTPIRINVGTKLNPVYKKLGELDTLYFALMEPNQAFEDAVVKKVYNHNSETDEEGNVLLKLKSSDTEKLLVGKYYYTVKLRSYDEYGEEYVRTIISNTLFWLEGNNPVPDKVEYYEKDKYQIDEIVYEGGEIL